jgi:hypothetical protein
MRYHLAIEAYLDALSLPRSNNLSNVWPIGRPTSRIAA